MLFTVAKRVIYIVQDLFHQGQGNRSISLKRHYLVLFKNPRDKLQILTLAKQMYPSETAWFIKEYEEAVRRPYGYLFVDLRSTTPKRCRLRTNVLPGEERFDKGFDENRISQYCSSTSNNKLCWCLRQFRRCNAFRMIWIISCIVQTLEWTKKRSSTCSCKTSFYTINTSSNL